MFRFPDDFDEEAEDFLSIPLEWEQNDKSVINSDENSNNKITNNSSVKNDTTFDDFDDEDDEMILSAVQSVDSINRNCTLDDSLQSHKQEQENRIPGKSVNSMDLVKNRRAQETMNSFVCRKPALSSFTSPTHNSVTFANSSPSACDHLKVEYERKFPGPAGLRLKNSRDSLLGDELNRSGLKNQLNNSIAENILQENTNWRELINDVKGKSCEQSKILNEFTVATLKRKNNIKHTHVARKIPLFAAVISYVDASVSDPSVELKDATGEIRGTIFRDLWEQYSHLLVVGSALLLRRVSMLSFGNSKRLYLNITTNNVDTIYSNTSGDGSVLITRVTSTVLDELYEEPTRCTIAENTITSSSTLISPRDEQVNGNVCQNSSIPSSVPSVDNELEGLDVDSLLGDF